MEAPRKTIMSAEINTVIEKVSENEGEAQKPEEIIVDSNKLDRNDAQQTVLGGPKDNEASTTEIRDETKSEMCETKDDVTETSSMTQEAIEKIDTEPTAVEKSETKKDEAKEQPKESGKDMPSETTVANAALETSEATKTAEQFNEQSKDDSSKAEIANAAAKASEAKKEQPNLSCEDTASKTEVAAIDTSMADAAATMENASLDSTQNNADQSTVSESGLSLLAQYNSDSDAESDVVEVPLEQEQEYRKVVEIKSESESSDSDSDDSDVGHLQAIRREIEKQMENDDDDDEDDDEMDHNGKPRKKQNSMRVKGELLLEDLPPIQDLHITVPEEECKELGHVHSIVDQLVLVSVIPDSLLFDLDTVLFLDKGKKVLGEVFDVLGQVADPLYCVRFNTHKEIEEKGIKVGDTVYVAPKTQYTQFVILSSLMKMRGSDASWENDIEPPPRYVDYSDDEQEREARARLRNKDRPNDHQDAAKRTRESNNGAGCSNTTSPQSRYTPSPSRGGASARYNRERPSSSFRQQRYDAPPSVPMNTSSWHSNYQHPYPYYGPAQPPPRHPSVHPHLTNRFMRPWFPPSMPPQFPTFSPIVGAAPIPPMAAPAPMYILNPYAVRPPVLSVNPILVPKTESPSSSSPPAPPGLD